MLRSSPIFVQNKPFYMYIMFEYARYKKEENQEWWYVISATWKAEVEGLQVQGHP